MKRLVIENLPFPISTFERSYKYKGYGFSLCRESKLKLLNAIRQTDPKNDNLSLYGSWD